MTEKLFSKEFEVYYYQINRRKQAEPVTILNFLEETAIAHSDSVGYGIDRLKEEGIGWVLINWKIEMDEYPLWNEKVTVETWPSSFERFFATRQFYIRNHARKIIGRASSMWMLINIEKRRPTRIPRHLGEAYGVNPLPEVKASFSELRPVEMPQYTREFFIRKSDIDTNEHVNNSRYVEWALEAVPDEIYENCSLASLEIEYKKETNYGSSIFSWCREMEGAMGMEFNHSILCKDDMSQLAVLKTVWRR